ncbi:MAG: FkbM family methyltransferase [Bryobacteraceae bacterium]
MNRRAFENLLHRKLLSLGWRVQRESPAVGRWRTSHAYWDADYIQRLGFRPATIIDVGIGQGTPDLYRAFPDAYLLLVEPIAEFFADIAGILASRQGVHVPVALGSEAGEREIRIEPRCLLQTSFYARHRLERTGDDPVLRHISVETLDRVVANHPCPRPFGLKIDAEGAELDIVRGAASTLRDTEFIIAEVSVLERFEGSYRFAGFIAEMDRLGFTVCDILDIGRANSTHVTYFDLVFQRKPA